MDPPPPAAMTSLDALLERLEQASGPNRELECSIHRMLAGTDVLPPSSFEYESAVLVAKPYTSSIDAALPIEGAFWWEIAGPARYLGIPTPVPNFWRASLTFDNNTVCGWGATEALARRIAELRALRARRATP